MSQDPDIAAAFGDELWSTDLFMPSYRSGEIGNWRINPGGQVVHDHGYHTRATLVEMLPWLVRRIRSEESDVSEGWELWMSLTPHEIESQELGCRCAFGEVVIMGLGMGWIAANAALNPKVTGVTVVELDPEVMELFRQSGAFESIPEPAQKKMRILNADALEWRPEVPGSVDFLYADIWLHLAEPATLGQVRKMQDNIKAETVYYWGQEIAIHCAARELMGPEVKLTSELVGQVLAERIKLPLLVPGDRDYPQMIEQVFRNRVARGLVVEVDVS